MNRLINKPRLLKTVLIIVFILLYIAEMPVDQYLPGVEGVSLGLNNIIIMTVLFAVGEPFAVVLVVVRIIMSVFFSEVNVLYPVMGGFLSLGVMYFAKRFIKKIGYIGVSVLGALTYNIITWLIACKLISNNILINNLPLVIVFSIIYGVIIGIISHLVISFVTRERKIGGIDE